MNTTDYESIWQQSLIRVTDEFILPPIVLRVDDAIIGTLGNFSVSTGKAKVYSSTYKRYFEDEDMMIRIEKDQKQKPFLSINGLSVPDWCEYKWQQLIKSNRAKKQ
ncbi:Uncharacterised protein [Porphyromonas macacae]|uniref:Uncharacterized protein n=1 Tax=Porphyromonas macacae TaxID=28115 RepID=A0A379EB04_9PORP|nr:Uncharacterised protein [Porphyromonas macacae]